jgi:hypothetical protein
MNPAFEVARLTGNNIAKAFQQSKDSSAIEQILSDAMRSGRPEDVQNSIGKILSQVSPERQSAAVQYLQNTYNTIQQKQAQDSQRNALKQAGLNPDLPTDLNKIMYEDNLNNQRARNIIGGAAIDAPTNQVLGDAAIGANPEQIVAGTQNPMTQQNQQVNKQNQTNQQNQTNKSFSWADLTDEQLVQLTGVKGFDKQANAEMKRRQEEVKANQSNFEPESDKLEAKAVADLAVEIQKDYQAAKNENLRLSRMETLDKEGNVSTPALVKALDAFGIPLGVLGNRNTEEYRKLEADFTRDVSKVFPGGKITNYEIQSYLKSIPTLMNSSEGRKAIIRNRKLMNDAKLVRYEEYKKIIKENNGKKPPNLGLLIDERTQVKISEIEDEFIKGVQDVINKTQVPIRMYDAQGNEYDVPPNMIEQAMQSGAKFSR